MDKIHLKNEFAKAFRPFCEEFGLVPIWYSDTLLNLEPIPGARARVQVSFKPGFWMDYEALNSVFRAVARAVAVAEVIQRRAFYRKLGPGESFAVHFDDLHL